MTIENSSENSVRRSRWGRRLFGALFVLFFAAFLFYWFQIRDVPVRISPETTWLTEPLTEDGTQVDYLKAFEEFLYPPQMQTDDNGFRLVARTLGAVNEHDEDKKPLAPLVYEKLGLPPDTKLTITFQHPSSIVYNFYKDKGEEPNYWELDKKLYQSPWTVEDFPMLASWITESEPAFDVMNEAIRKPVFVVPLVKFDEKDNLFAANFNTDPSRWRNWMRAYQARICHRFGVGDIDGAIDDIVSCHLLARHIMNNGGTIAFMTGVAIDQVAERFTLNLNPDFPPTQEQLERLERERKNLPKWLPAQEYIKRDRLEMLDMVQNLARENTFYDPNDLSDGDLPRRYFGYDWNVVLRELNCCYDSIEATGTYTFMKRPGIFGHCDRATRSRRYATELISPEDSREHFDGKSHLEFFLTKIHKEP